VLTKIISHPDDHQVFSFLRKNDNDEVLVVLNFSPVEISFQVKEVHGVFRNVFGGSDVNFDRQDHLALNPWGYIVFEKMPMLSDLE
jgi:glycosidase